MATVEIPTYLKDEYRPEQGEHLQCLDSLMAWYWCSIPILKESVTSSGIVWDEFLNKVKKCNTMLDMKNLVNQYV